MPVTSEIPAIPAILVIPTSGLRVDQLEALTELTRRVKRARRHRQEPVTDNTLLRIAVDLLLAHADRLGGDTEGELRASVLPRERRSR